MTRFDDEFLIRSILYSVNSNIAPHFRWSSISPISVVNLILLIIPCAYFTYRNESRYEGENVAILGAITILLTFIVAIILDYSAFFSSYLVDESSTPTPNFDFLPVFCILLIIAHIIIPLLREHLKIPTRSEYQEPAYSWTKRIQMKLPSTLSGWIIVILLFIPSLIYLSFSTLVTEDFEVIMSIQSTLYTLGAEFYVGATYIETSLEFLIGGMVFFDLMLLVSIWNFIYLFGFALYCEGKIQRSRMIFLGLLSLGPMLFVSLITLIATLLQISSILTIPLPLVQLGSLLVLRQSEKTRKQNTEGISGDGFSQKLKIPLMYLIKSKLSRRGRQHSWDIENPETSTTDEIEGGE